MTFELKRGRPVSPSTPLKRLCADNLNRYRPAPIITHFDLGPAPAAAAAAAPPQVDDISAFCLQVVNEIIDKVVQDESDIHDSDMSESDDEDEGLLVLDAIVELTVASVEASARPSMNGYASDGGFVVDDDSEDDSEDEEEDEVIDLTGDDSADDTDCYDSDY